MRAARAALTAHTMKAVLKPVFAPVSIPVAATVERAATPTDPPTSWKVLTMPEASPASWRET
ncbi:hypothetical protein [Microbispora sp. H10836]|uniref:hypothetical protein n=1 Tax=Microbispora sp. H10836 TaxID=2729106 RepID=UPI001B8A981C|nr:hypothetical protein [Microbispora sp. H10836]